MTSVTQASCPDWKSLAREAFAGENQSPDAESHHHLSECSGSTQERTWLQALEHQKSCDVCRTAALEADPTVVFQRMPEIELSAAEIETMRERVAGVRKGRTVAGGEALQGKSAAVRRSGRLQWLSAAAFLAISIGGALNLTVTPEAAASGLTAADEAALEAALGAQPLVEGVDLYGSDQSVLMVGQMQGASGEVDFAWVVDGDLAP